MRTKPLVPRAPLWLPRIPFALTLRRRPRLRRALVLGLAAVVAVVVTGTLRGAEAARAAWGHRRPVVVAVRDLAPGRVLTGGDTEVRTMPDALVPDGALARVADGRVVRAGVLAGEVLQRRRLTEPDVHGVAALLPDGTRAVAVPADEGDAPPLEVGQRVDVVAVAVGDGGAAAAVIAAGALVVAVGEHAVTVAVEAGAVPRIVAALAQGAITLALVGPPDPDGQRAT